VSPVPSAQPGSTLVAAEVQQRIENLAYLVQTQQQQLEQAQSVINDYQQTFTGTPQAQPLLPPAARSSGDSDSAAPVVPRRYITGGLGQSGEAIPVDFQTAPAQSVPPAKRVWRRYSLPTGWPGRLTRTGLVLALSALTGWVVFKYAAPPIGNWLFPEPTVSTSEPSAAPEPAAPEPQSNLSEENPPGSAANKAGTLPPIPTTPPPALEQ
ncbi:MAG: hypothetical protein WBB01_04720, partial [Phormidesmis sp.]